MSRSASKTGNTRSNIFVAKQIEQEKKRIKSHITALEKTTANQQAEEVDEDEQINRLFGHLIRSNNDKLESLGFAEKSSLETEWEAPLPVPDELESVERFENLLSACSKLYGGDVKVLSLAKGDDYWEMDVSANSNLVTFKLKFKVVREILSKGKYKRECVKDLSVSGLSEGFQQELAPLIQMAEKLNCVRTFFVGFGEYVNFYQQRHAVFKTVREKAGNGTVEGGEDITGDEAADTITIRSVNSKNKKTCTISWKPNWRIYAPKGVELLLSPTEFLMHELKVDSVKVPNTDLEKRDIDKIVSQSRNAFAALLRLHKGNVATAILSLIAVINS